MKINRIVLSALFLVLGVVSVIYTRHVIEQRRVAGVQTEETKVITGIIVPHHKLAHDLIDNAYQRAEGEEYSYIVILAPNHFYPTAPSIITTRELPNVSINASIIDTLMQKFKEITIDQEMILGEHAIMLQTEYVHRYFPDAQLIPLMMSPVLTREKAEEFARILVDTMPSDTLYLASVDFSHNSTVSEGLNNNEETIAALRDFDIQQVYEFTDDHLDAPFATAVWLSVLNTVGAREFQLWQSSHSGVLTKDSENQGTSYVTAAFYR